MPDRAALHWLELAVSSGERLQPDHHAGPEGRATWRASIDARSCGDDQGLFRALQDALDLPGYFGFNWDALEEVVLDLLDLAAGGMGSAFGDRAGHPGTRLELVVHHADRLLADEPVRKLTILLDVLRRAARDGRGDGRAGIRVLLECEAEAFDGFRKRLRLAGVHEEDLRPHR